MVATKAIAAHPRRATTNNSANTPAQPRILATADFEMSAGETRGG